MDYGTRRTPQVPSPNQRVHHRYNPVPHLGMTVVLATAAPIRRQSLADGVPVW